MVELFLTAYVAFAVTLLAERAILLGPDRVSAIQAVLPIPRWVAVVTICCTTIAECASWPLTMFAAQVMVRYQTRPSPSEFGGDEMVEINADGVITPVRGGPAFEDNPSVYIEWFGPREFELAWDGPHISDEGLCDGLRVVAKAIEDGKSYRTNEWVQ